MVPLGCNHGGSPGVDSRISSLAGDAQFLELGGHVGGCVGSNYLLVDRPDDPFLVDVEGPSFGHRRPSWTTP